MAYTLTLQELTTEIGMVTSASDARAVVNRASRVAGVPDNRQLEMRELLRVCQALAAEGRDGAADRGADRPARAGVAADRRAAAPLSLGRWRYAATSPASSP